MGLFDNIKNKINEAALGLKEGYEIAMTKDIYTLCDELALYKEFDPKKAPITMAIDAKCDQLHDFDLEDIYNYYKKQGKLLKKHPAEKILVEKLVKRHIYIKNDDGTYSRNMLAKKRPK